MSLSDPAPPLAMIFSEVRPPRPVLFARKHRDDKPIEADLIGVTKLGTHMLLCLIRFPGYEEYVDPARVLDRGDPVWPENVVPLRPAGAPLWAAGA
jgi:hypothetical protein